MQADRLVPALALLLALDAAQAEIINSAQVWRYPVTTESYGPSIMTRDGSDAALTLQGRLVSVPVEYALASTATTGSIDVRARLDWNPATPANPLGEAGVGAAIGGHVFKHRLGPGEAIRYRIDFDLQSDAHAKTEFKFSLYDRDRETYLTNMWTGTGIGHSAPEHLTGTWYSNWLTAPADGTGLGLNAYIELEALSVYPVLDAEYALGTSVASGRVDFRYEIAPVPEPETWALVLTGFGSVAWAARRRARAAVA